MVTQKSSVFLDFLSSGCKLEVNLLRTGLSALSDPVADICFPPSEKKM